MFRRSIALRVTLLALGMSLLATTIGAGRPSDKAAAPANRMAKRWLFIWRDMSNPAEVDRMIARFPAAHAAGYNGVAFSYNIAPERAAALKAAAKQNGLDLIAIVMGGGRDKNYVEGVLDKDALFVASNGVARFKADNPTVLLNTGFEDVRGNHLNGWAWQDTEGVTTFADHEVAHSGNTSLRMEAFSK